MEREKFEEKNFRAPAFAAAYMISVKRMTRMAAVAKVKEAVSSNNFWTQQYQIIRNKLKINATINNSKIFKKIQQEYGTFYNYLKTFTQEQIIYETDKTTNQLSDVLSKDLQKRGMKFVGSTIIYSYLQAIGVIYSHDTKCFMYKDR